MGIYRRYDLTKYGYSKHPQLVRLPEDLDSIVVKCTFQWETLRETFEPDDFTGASTQFLIWIEKYADEHDWISCSIEGLVLN